MTSAAPPPQPAVPAASQQQQANPPYHHHAPSPSQGHTAISPPNKQNLKSWWKGFKLPSKHQDSNADNRPQGIFGVPLRQSITYANVAISLVDENGESYIYGYVPIVVAKCGVFLKEKATEVEGIFRLSGSEKRIKELKYIFDSPDRYGKGLVWDGFTVHDAANVLRRYLNDLPEPVVPLYLYEQFREPLRGAIRQTVGDVEGPQFVENFNMEEAIVRYQRLIKELPQLNRQLLLYILDLLAVFAAKADLNRMNSQNLAAIFQPGMLSHPNHAMAPEEYRLNQCVIIFLIENQDHFLIGMQGTAADEKTVREVQKGNPIIKVPSTPAPIRKSGLTRSSSNASAGAESVAKEGQVRRNKSTSSRRSRHSNSNAPSPGSPALATTPTGGLGRSNTVPSKKSPALPSGRFASRNDPSSGSVVPLTPLTPTAPTMAAPPTVVEEGATPQEETPAPPIPATIVTSGLLSDPPAGKNLEGLLDPNPDTAPTPTRERRLPSLFQRSPTGEIEGRQPNKLRKKMPGSAHPSANSSTASLPHSAAASPSVELSNPLETILSQSRSVHAEGSSEAQTGEILSESTPRVSQVPSNKTLHPNSAESALRTKRSPTTSLHSSFNEGSDLDQVDEPAGVAGAGIASPDSLADKETKKRWRLSRKKEDIPPTSNPSTGSPRTTLGSNSYAEVSTSTVGSSGYKPRQSMTGDSSDRGTLGLDGSPGSEAGSKDSRDDGRSITSWLKNKYREHKETAEQRRAMSPPGDRSSMPLGANILPTRGKSLDLRRGTSDERSPPPPVPQPQPQFQPKAQEQQRPSAQEPQTALDPQDPNVPHAL
ncbi:hypothetical protein B0T17DRAFT_485037 [Bombardia bombarda]|uniref:Rho-GAP domain-containing protein n=1 Tax=Bombardia bombarda TaxID=252184 RepID=A0AA39XPA2_9PEZI|nr:hypothetical protein B0T17DRAFT_485037 [Bombardia bombarda]